jgi:IS1 family transposase
VALDPETKLVPAYLIGKRDLPTATTFITGLSERLANRVQLSSDALAAYVEATEWTFGAHIDYGQIVKAYEAEPVGRGRYSPPHVVGAKHSVIVGNPDRAHISTSLIERQNLTMRMSMRRYGKVSAFGHALALMAPFDQHAGQQPEGGGSDPASPGQWLIRLRMSLSLTESS